jgi:aminopeptidase N
VNDAPAVGRSQTVRSLGRVSHLPRSSLRVASSFLLNFACFVFEPVALDLPRLDGDALMNRGCSFPLCVPLCLVLGLAFVSPPSAGDTYTRQPGVDAQHYAFRVILRDDSDEIDAEATVSLRWLQEIPTFWLDLASVPPGGGGGKTADGKVAETRRGMMVSGVRSAGADVAFEHKGNRLTITLPQPVAAGETRSVEIRYHGVPRAGLRIGKNRHGERTFFSENFPDKARHWLPMVDHPSDKATSEFFVTAPARYQVVANGLLQEERDLGDGRRLTHWKQSVPIASWLNAVGVAQFAAHHAGTVKGVPLQSWVYTQDRERAMPILEKPARRVLEFYSEHIGPFPYEKLAGVQAAGVSGGTEHASAIFYGEGNVLSGERDGLVAHEIAHQWFGDSVTERDWDDVWLSEGFASYFTLLFTEHDRGRDAFVAGLKRSRDQVFAIESRNPDLAVIHQNLSNMGRVLNGLVYQKGAWILHMLRGKLGTETFWSGIRSYYARYRDGNASSDDFRRVMEETAGASLDWFFQQWLRRPGSPKVDGRWEYRPADKRVVLELTQVQRGEPFRLPIELEIGAPDAASGAERQVETLELTEHKQRFEIPSPVAPASLSLDPNCRMLIKSTMERKSVN